MQDELAAYSLEQLIALNRRIVSAIKEKSRIANDRAMFTLHVGDKVRSKWDVRPSRLAGLDGVVIDVLRTRVMVQTAHGRVRYTADALEVIK